MKFANKLLASLMLIIALCVTACGPTGCSKTTLSPDGVYHGDKFLYNAEKTIVTSYKTFDAFLKWEETNRNALPIEVTQTADVIRLNAKKWIDTASAFRDVYVQNPTAENRGKLDLALGMIERGLAEANKYYLQYGGGGSGGTNGK